MHFDLKGNLTHKIGPLPVWAWGLSGGVLLGLYLRHRSASSSTSASSTDTSAVPAGADTSLGAGPLDLGAGGLGGSAGGSAGAGTFTDPTPLGADPATSAMDWQSFLDSLFGPQTATPSSLGRTPGIGPAPAAVVPTVDQNGNIVAPHAGTYANGDAIARVLNNARNDTGLSRNQTPSSAAVRRVADFQPPDAVVRYLADHSAAVVARATRGGGGGSSYPDSGTVTTVAAPEPTHIAPVQDSGQPFTPAASGGARVAF